MIWRWWLSLLLGLTASLIVAAPLWADDFRPAYLQLLAEIERNGYLATGRKYGVSDNAIRKWVRFYENEIERGTREAA